MPDASKRALLAAAYVFLAVSDAVDGPLARRAGGANRFWGRLDAGADIAFNALALAAASAIGYVGLWVPAGVALLGARFLWRSRGAAAEGALPEDAPGKAAGVIFFALVGAVVFDLVFGGGAWRWAVARAGDGVFLYTAILLVRRPHISEPGP